jgi:hypothetical protein
VRHQVSHPYSTSYPDHEVHKQRVILWNWKRQDTVRSLNMEGCCCCWWWWRWYCKFKEKHSIADTSYHGGRNKLL